MIIHRRNVTKSIIVFIIVSMTIILFSHSLGTNETLLSVAKRCHNYLVENKYRYVHGAGRTYPLSVDDGNGIDCSGYVSWVIYEYQNGNFEGKTSKWFLTTAKRLYIGQALENPEFCVGWEAIKGSDNYLPGDILCYRGHVQIYIGPDKECEDHYLVYNAGSNTSMKTYTTSINEKYFKKAEYALRLP